MIRPLKKVLVFGIDNFSAKNRYQVEELSKYGYRFVFETLNSRGDSCENFRGLEELGNVIELAPRGFSHFFGRLWSAVRLLRKHKAHHIEVYPGGRFAFVYVCLAWLMQKKSIVVERGDLVDWYEKPLSLRISMWICYKLSTIVWYKEPYMENILDGIGVKKKFFIHNAGPTVKDVKSCLKREIDFLWVNRLIEQRRADWFVDILAKKSLEELLIF